MFFSSLLSMKSNAVFDAVGLLALGGKISSVIKNKSGLLASISG